MRSVAFPLRVFAQEVTCPQRDAASRSELFSGASSSTTPLSPMAHSDSRRRFLSGQQSGSSDISESPFRGPSPMPQSSLREDHALREHSFIQNTDSRLDEFLAHGRAVLDDLRDQRSVLKGTHKRLLDAAHTLGLSRDVIGWIERRRYALSSRPRARADSRVKYTRHVHLLCWCYFHFCVLLFHLAIPGLTSTLPFLAFYLLIICRVSI